MKMNYFVVGTNNMQKATQFYDSLFEQSKLEKVVPTKRMTYWLGDDFAFAAALPFNEAPATNGNGTMVGFSVGSADEVTRMYDKAIELGAACEGEPGQRGPRFSAYVRDLDRNKICFTD
ncbi:VOC family protein [Vibrio orientalis]|uniref:Lactoylglutathione lyase n=2 Tax=Vibrio orientalis CIP 102891 = ATCC 33934 TaxID=675816 RepID=A0ABM9YYM4_VIBOR|nr:VOC family protein [Vibrio orientalis]EEX92523.1 lactoylglutathione lyase [Vibrio orientalis CIP 102891 = ATCC 33934]